MEGALVSSSGDFMQNVAQSWLVWHISQSPVAIGVIAVFDTLPRILLGAVGGAIADRFDRRRVLMITQALAMFQAILYWLVVQFEVVALWQIAILAFFLGVVKHDQSNRAPVAGQQFGPQGRVAQCHRLAIFGV
jgi:MFS family permease